MIRNLNVEGQPEQPPRRVPDRDIVDVGHPDSAEPLDLGEIALPGPFRRETLARARKHPGNRRGLTRPLTALLVLGLGLLGGLYVSKRYTDSHVIVVPAPTNERSVIT